MVLDAGGAVVTLDSRTLYAITDLRTGSICVRPGGQFPPGMDPDAISVETATREQAETLWQNPLHAGWNVAK